MKKIRAVLLRKDEIVGSDFFQNCRSALFGLFGRLPRVPGLFRHREVGVRVLARSCRFRSSFSIVIASGYFFGIFPFGHGVRRFVILCVDHHWLVLGHDIQGAEPHIRVHRHSNGDSADAVRRHFFLSGP